MARPDFMYWPCVVHLHVALAALAVCLGEIEGAPLTRQASPVARGSSSLGHHELAVPLPAAMQAGQDPALCGLLSFLIVRRRKLRRFFRSDSCPDRRSDSGEALAVA